MNTTMKIGVWFALAAVVGLWTQTRGGTSTPAPKAAKVRAVAPALR